MFPQHETIGAVSHATKCATQKQLKPEKCLCCGQIILPKLILPATKQRIYDYMLAHGQATVSALVDYVYALDPNGGPATDRKCIHVHVNHLNKILADVGLKICGQRGRGGYYRLTKL